MIQQGIVPVPGIAGRPARNYETEQSAKLSIADTGTSFIAGQTLSSTDDKWLRKIGAEQKLFDGVSISGSIGETAQGDDQQEHQRRLQAQLVNRPHRRRQSRFPGIIQHCRILAAMRSNSAALMAPLRLSSCGGHPRSLQTRNRGIADERHSFRKRLKSTEADTISPRSRKSRLASATSSATTSPICAARRRARNAETALEPDAEATVNNVNSLIQRVAGTSLAEIENLISELESLRDLLHAEGQRVQREISGYAQLSQAAMKSTRMIADNVAQWKRAADGLRNG